MRKSLSNQSFSKCSIDDIYISWVLLSVGMPQPTISKYVGKCVLNTVYIADCLTYSPIKPPPLPLWTKGLIAPKDGSASNSLWDLLKSMVYFWSAQKRITVVVETTYLEYYSIFIET